MPFRIPHTDRKTDCRDIWVPAVSARLRRKQVYGRSFSSSSIRFQHGRRNCVQGVLLRFEVQIHMMGAVVE